MDPVPDACSSPLPLVTGEQLTRRGEQMPFPECRESLFYKAQRFLGFIHKDLRFLEGFEHCVLLFLQSAGSQGERGFEALEGALQCFGKILCPFLTRFRGQKSYFFLSGFEFFVE